MKYLNPGHALTAYYDTEKIKKKGSRMIENRDHMLPKILRTGGAKVIPHGSAKAKQNKELAAAVVATRPKSGKSIGGVRKRSSGKKGKHTAGGGADIFSEENPFAGVSFGGK